MVGAGNLPNVVGGELLVGAVHHGAHIAGIDKQGFALAVAVVAVAVAGNGFGFLVLGEEPEAHGNLGGVEQLARQGDHAIHQVILDELLADLAFTFCVGAHGAVSQYKAGHAALAELADHVQNPGVVGVAGGRHFVTGPAWVVGEFIRAAPCF